MSAENKPVTMRCDTCKWHNPTMLADFVECREDSPLCHALKPDAVWPLVGLADWCARWDGDNGTGERAAFDRKGRALDEKAP